VTVKHTPHIHTHTHAHKLCCASHTSATLSGSDEEVVEDELHVAGPSFSAQKHRLKTTVKFQTWGHGY